MDETLKGVLYTAIGFTTAKISDYFFLSKGHSLALKKEYFMRKLNAFEKATSYYTITHASITTISLLFKALNKENVDFSPEVSNTMMAKIQENLDKVSSVTMDTALSLPLYTDLKLFDENEDNLVEKYFDKLGEINLIIQVIGLFNEQIKKEEPRMAAKTQNIIDNEFSEVEKKIKELTSLSEALKIKYQRLTASLRQEIKKYDN